MLSKGPLFPYTINLPSYKPPKTCSPTICSGTLCITTMGCDLYTVSTVIYGNMKSQITRLLSKSVVAVGLWDLVLGKNGKFWTGQMLIYRWHPQQKPACLLMKERTMAHGLRCTCNSHIYIYQADHYTSKVGGKTLHPLIKKNASTHKK